MSLSCCYILIMKIAIGGMKMSTKNSSKRKVIIGVSIVLIALRGKIKKNIYLQK